MIPSSKVLSGLIPGLMKPKPVQAQSQTQIQKARSKSITSTECRS